MTSEFHLNSQFWPANERFIKRGPFTLDLLERLVIYNQKPIRLPQCAFECLVLLVRNSPKPVSFLDLAQASPGLQLSQLDIQDRARMHIYILKKSLENNQESSRRIKAIPGFGYWLNIN
jgi:DNA-binding response OmpR family regulator